MLHLEPWNSPEITSLTAHLYSCHIHICITSTQPYQKSVSCSRQTDTQSFSQQSRVCVTVNSSAVKIWTSLPFQPGLVNVPWAMKPGNVCVYFVWLYVYIYMCVCLKGNASKWDLVTLTWTCPRTARFMKTKGHSFTWWTVMDWKWWITKILDFTEIKNKKNHQSWLQRWKHTTGHSNKTYTK